jgi:hypothetical protein
VVPSPAGADPLASAGRPVGADIPDEAASADASVTGGAGEAPEAPCAAVAIGEPQTSQ